MQVIEPDGITAGSAPSVHLLRRGPVRTGLSVAAVPDLRLSIAPKDLFAILAIPNVWDDLGELAGRFHDSRRALAARLPELEVEFKRSTEFFAVDGQHRLKALDDARKGFEWQTTGAGKTSAALAIAHEYLHRELPPRAEPADNPLANPAAELWLIGHTRAVDVFNSALQLTAGRPTTTWPRPVSSPLPPPQSDLEPLATACGVTRLSRPPVPRAPGVEPAGGSAWVGVFRAPLPRLGLALAS